MKAYLFTYNTALSSNYINNLLNTSNAINTWVSPYHGTSIIISQLTVSELSAVLHSHLDDIWFIVIEATPTNSNGWLPGNFWDYISDPNTAWTSSLLSSLTSPHNALLDNK
jgi:hypothetical protein